MIEQLMAILFLSRDLAHREHLRTKSYAQHKALQKFYEGIVEQAEFFAYRSALRQIAVKPVEQWS
jgi:hypothetical protein